MADSFALPSLFEAVKARFETDLTPVKNYFGWREPARQRDSNRITWTPGDTSGSVGKHQGAKNNGGAEGLPRSLSTLGELVTVEINGFDVADPENELLQYTRARAIYDAWYRAVYLYAYGTFQIVSTNWVVDKKERRHGATLRVVLAVAAMIPDKPYQADPLEGFAPVDMTSDITTELDDNADGTGTEEIITVTQEG